MTDAERIARLPLVDQQWIAAAAQRKAALARDLDRAIAARKARLATYR